jgi:CubicO group peptidase (beta-lactamase class C family)
MASRSEPPRLRCTSALLALACVTANGCLPDAEFKHRGPVVPEPLNDGWEIASPESVGLDPEALAGIHEELLREDRNFATLGMLVIKDGKLVWETYLRTLADRDRYHHIQSATKSVTSLAFGIARGDGLFPDLDAPLSEFVPDELEGLDPKKAAITLEHLLTMRSGLDFDNDVFSVEMWVDKPSDPLRYILKKPLYADPGERFYYRDADPQIIGYLLDRETGQSEEAFVQERLFEPLGIEDYYWEAGHDGTTLAAHGLHLRPRDLAKFGQLLLDGCAWHGEQLVPRAWCEDATREHVSADDVSDDEEGRAYGYYYWVLAEPEAFAAWGHGGQFVLVVPAKRMVLVQVALPDGDDLHGSILRQFVALTEPLWR